MRAFFIFLSGMIASLMIAFVAWIASSDCPPNRLILKVYLPETMTAEVFLEGQSLWKGTRANKTINFPFSSGEGQFHVQRSDGASKDFGYVEWGDGDDHVIIVNEDSINYAIIQHDIPEFFRRQTACIIGRRFERYQAWKAATASQPTQPQ